jgi:hypothetical protein
MVAVVEAKERVDEVHIEGLVSLVQWSRLAGRRSLGANVW